MVAVVVTELVVVVSFIVPTTVRTVSSFFPPLNDVCQPNYFYDDQETQPPSFVCRDRNSQNKRNTVDGIVVVVVTECICSSRRVAVKNLVSLFGCGRMPPGSWAMSRTRSESSHQYRYDGITGC